MLVKDNHPLLHRKLRAFFASGCLFEAEFATHQSHDLGHGRVESRHLTVSSDVPAGYTGFIDVRQVFRLKRQRVLQKSGALQEETWYGLTSLPASEADPKRLLGLLRGHWHIENKSHWVRDVIFDEDRSQVRCGHIPQVMAALRNTCIGLMRLQGHHQIATMCRHFAAQPHKALALLGIPEN